MTPKDDNAEGLWERRKESTSQVMLTRPVRYMCWAGKKERLIRIEEFLSASLHKLYQQNVPDEVDESDREKFVRRRVRLERMAEDLQLQTQVTSSKGKLKRSGPLSDVFDELDVSEVEGIAMSTSGFGSDPGSVTLKLRRASFSDVFFGSDNFGASLEVSGIDRQWVGGTFDWVSGELRKDVPWWSVLRRTWAGILVGLLISMGVAAIVFADSSTQDRHNATLVSHWFETMAGVGLVCGFFVIRPLLGLIFPSFEMLEPGSSPRGRQLMGISVGVLSFGMTVAGLVLGLRSR